MNLEQLATDLRKNEALGHWPKLWLMVWVRDNCRCVYCGRDMIESYETANYLYEHDHLLPYCEYHELDMVEWNRVLSCSPCNRIKSTFDPNRFTVHGPEQVPIYVQGKTPTETERTLLLQRVRDFIAQQKQPYRERFEKERALLLEALSTLRHPHAAAAGA